MANPFSRAKSPSLNALRAFESAARHQSFAKAAQELNVTAGAVAQQVKQLEDWIGTPLFQRSAQGIKLTKEAYQALPLLTKAFDQLSDAASKLRHIGKPKEITIAALPSIALLWLSPRLPRLAALFPEYFISITALEYPPNFQRDDFDLAFFYVDGETEGARTLSLGKDTLTPVCSASIITGTHPLDTVANLSNFRLLHDATWRNHWQLWLDYAGCSQVDASQGSMFSIYSLALQAAVDGAGIMMGRSKLVRQAMAAGQLVAPFDVAMPEPDELSLLMPEESPLLPMLGPLLHILES